MGGLDRAIRLGLFCSQIQGGRAGDGFTFQSLQDGPIGLASALFFYLVSKTYRIHWTHCYPSCKIRRNPDLTLFGS